MGERARVQFAQSAVDDLLEIRDWYARQDADATGQRVTATFIDQVEQLATLPDSGRVVPEFEVDWLRELVVPPPFRVVYRRDPQVVTVVRVWRSERLMDLEAAAIPDPDG